MDDIALNAAQLSPEHNVHHGATSGSMSLRKNCQVVWQDPLPFYQVWKGGIRESGFRLWL